jgi:hypothetical protein
VGRAEETESEMKIKEVGIQNVLIWPCKNNE